jgi:hypothetical protein
MRKKIILWLFLLIGLSFTLQSCRTDEVIQEEKQTTREKIAAFEKFENNLASKKLLQKGDLRYISYHEPFKEIVQAYMNNNPSFNQDFHNEVGDVYFDLRSFTYGETTKGLVYPIIKNGVVNAVLMGIVNPERDWVNFTVLKNNSPEVSQIISKFQTLYVSSQLSKGREVMEEHEIEEVVITIYQSIPGPFYTYYQPYTDYGGSDSSGLGSGMSGGGSHYRGGGNPPDPCVKTKAKLTNPKFKAKYQELNKPEMFAMNHEKGFYERLPPAGSTGIESGFPVVDGAPCTHGLDFPENENGVAGLMHTHNEENCNGDPSVKIFSPKDVRTFLNKLMPQANNYTGSYTNAYSVVITSQGSYMLQYTNSTWPGSTWDKINDWNDWYVDAYNNLIMKDEFTQGNIEKVFTQFLKEKVGIDGLEVYKITESSSSKLEYNGTNQPVKSTPCPQ